MSIEAARAEVLAAVEAPWPPIVYSVEYRSEVTDFPTYVGFDCFPGPAEHAVVAGIVLARRFAAALSCKSLCDGSGLGDDPSPYWSLLWDGDRLFLADDCNTAFADGQGRLVRIVRERPVPALDLDAHGALI